MTDERFDKLMKNCVDPETEAFGYRPRKRTVLKTVSVTAASLVLVLLAAVIIPVLGGGKHSFVLTVNAAGDRAGDSQLGTIYTECNVYDKDMNFIERYYIMQAELMLNGDDIEDVSFRSLNGYGRFSVFYDPDHDDYHDDCGWSCDPDGNIDMDYAGWRTYDYPEYYDIAYIDPANDWSVPYLYHIQYIAIADDGYFLQPDAVSSDRDDIIEITVTFTDGDTLTKRLSVTYPEGIMTVNEIS